jgi:hypothetical protein
MARFSGEDVFRLPDDEEKEIYYEVPGTSDAKTVLIYNLRQDMRILQRTLSDAHDHMLSGNPFKAFKLLDHMMDLMQDTCA